MFIEYCKQKMSEIVHLKCKKCGEEKPTTEFYIYKKSGNPWSRCILCEKDRSRKYYKHKVMPIRDRVALDCLYCNTSKPVGEFY